jgi:hypothetical protein
MAGPATEPSGRGDALSSGSDGSRGWSPGSAVAGRLVGQGGRVHRTGRCRRRSASGRGSRLEVDGPHLPRPAGLGSHDGRRDDAGRQSVDRRELTRVQAASGDPHPIADREAGSPGAGREIDRGDGGPLVWRVGARAARSSRFPGPRRPRRCVAGWRVGRLALSGGHWLSGPPGSCSTAGPPLAECARVLAGAACHTAVTRPLADRPPAPCEPRARPRRRTTAEVWPSRRDCDRATSAPRFRAPPSHDARSRPACVHRPRRRT